jgi:hypothetical protein
LPLNPRTDLRGTRLSDVSRAQCHGLHYEFAAGSWINRRHQLLKASYEWLRMENVPGTKLNVLGFQFVTTFHAYDRAFHQ